MGLEIRVISFSDDLARLLLIFTIAHRLVAVYPKLLPDLASVDVVGRSDLFKWDHWHVRDVVSLWIEMCSGCSVKVSVRDVTPVIVVSLLRFPACFPYVQELRTTTADQLIYHILGITINCRLDVPGLSRSVTFVCLNRVCAMHAHYTGTSTPVTLFEPNGFPSGVSFQGHFCAYQCVSEVLVALIACETWFGENMPDSSKEEERYFST